MFTMFMLEEMDGKGSVLEMSVGMSDGYYGMLSEVFFESCKNIIAFLVCHCWMKGLLAEANFNR